MNIESGRKLFHTGLSDSVSETSYKKIGTEANDRAGADFHIFDYDEYDAQIFKLPNKSLTEYVCFMFSVSFFFFLRNFASFLSAVVYLFL